MSHVRTTAFARQFDPAYLVVRKDISHHHLLAAAGDLDGVAKSVEKDEGLIQETNRDGNTLLLMAIANQHMPIVHMLLRLKSDIAHRNNAGMDALDYATMDGCRKPLARMILQRCEYVVPELVDGPYMQAGDRVLGRLREAGLRVVKTSIIGKTPNFIDPHPQDAEYKTEWLRNTLFVVGTVQRGLLLLNHEIGYLERDAIITGSLEVPAPKRYVYHAGESKVISFAKAMARTDVYAGAVDKRLLQACKEGEALPVQGLLKARASPNLQDIYGSTALMIAARAGNFPIAKCLVLNRAKVDDANKDGYTPLLLASVGNHSNVVRLLLRAKADPFAKTYRGNSVVSFVKHEGYQDILHIIYQEQAAQKQRRAETAASQSRSAFAPLARGVMGMLGFA
mmetsp:Transcript_54718/g.158968  ORF Transcript_54718/g.158968 Transcript_54718/m.158968 type:complete len:395 (-) Transcript_54718:256-1440(-)